MENETLDQLCLAMGLLANITRNEDQEKKYQGIIKELKSRIVK